MHQGSVGEARVQAVVNLWIGSDTYIERMCQCYSARANRDSSESSSENMFRLTQQGGHFWGICLSMDRITE